MGQRRLIRIAISVSVLVHATGFAALAAWTTSAASSSVRLLGRKQVIQLTVSFAEPQWTAEPATLDVPRKETAVLIEPKEARIGKRRYVHVSTGELPLTAPLLDSASELVPAVPRRRKRDEAVDEMALSAPTTVEIPRRPSETRKPDLALVQPPSNSGNADETPPDLSQNAPPTYPAYAIQRGWEGTVLLRIWVDETGSISKVEVARSSGYRILDGAAATAVRKWHAVPASRGGNPVATVELLPVRFKL